MVFQYKQSNFKIALWLQLFPYLQTVSFFWDCRGVGTLTKTNTISIRRRTNATKAKKEPTDNRIAYRRASSWSLIIPSLDRKSMEILRLDKNADDNILKIRPRCFRTQHVLYCVLPAASVDVIRHLVNIQRIHKITEVLLFNNCWVSVLICCRGRLQSPPSATGWLTRFAILTPNATIDTRWDYDERHDGLGQATAQSQVRYAYSSFTSEVVVQCAASTQTSPRIAPPPSASRSVR